MPFMVKKNGATAENSGFEGERSFEILPSSTLNGMLFGL